MPHKAWSCWIRTACTAILVTLSPLTVANADNEVWTDWHYVSTLQPTLNGRVYITLRGTAVTCGNSDGQTETFAQLVNTDVSTNNVPAAENGGFSAVYSTLLTAKVASLEVRLWLSPSLDGRGCYVQQVVIR